MKYPVLRYHNWSRRISSLVPTEALLHALKRMGYFIVLLAAFVGISLAAFILIELLIVGI